MTQEEFNEMFVVAMGTYGRAIENEADVPTVSAEELTGNDAPLYSMPMVKDESGLMSYAKVGMTDMIEAIADNVATEGLYEALTQAEIDEILYGSSSSSD